MPQASEEDRAKWGGFQGICEDKAMDHLKAHGFVLTAGWEWRKPSPDYELNEQDIGAINFLIDEWDYGGLAQ